MTDLRIGYGVNDGGYVGILVGYTGEDDGLYGVDITDDNELYRICYIEEEDTEAELPPEEVKVILDFIRERIDFHLNKGG